MAQPDGRISTKVEYGRHITLACRNHPDLAWHTKNISPIGARSIFYIGKWPKRATEYVPECSCPARDLIVHPRYDGAQDVPASGTPTLSEASPWH